jgi:hypothetical protein
LNKNLIQLPSIGTHPVTFLLVTGHHPFSLLVSWPLLTVPFKLRAKNKTSWKILEYRNQGKLYDWPPIQHPEMWFYSAGMEQTPGHEHTVEREQGLELGLLVLSCL